MFGKGSFWSEKAMRASLLLPASKPTRASLLIRRVRITLKLCPHPFSSSCARIPSSFIFSGKKSERSTFPFRFVFVPEAADSEMTRAHPFSSRVVSASLLFAAPFPTLASLLLAATLASLLLGPVFPTLASLLFGPFSFEAVLPTGNACRKLVFPYLT